MANEKNLISLKNRSNEETTKIASMGGKATQAKKRAERTIKEKYTIALEILRKRAERNTTDEDLKSVLDETDILVLEKFKMLFTPGLKKETKLKVMESIEDRLHGKPKQSTDITSNGESIKPQIIIGD